MSFLDAIKNSVIKGFQTNAFLRLYDKAEVCREKRRLLSVRDEPARRGKREQGFYAREE